MTQAGTPFTVWAPRAAQVDAVLVHPEAQGFSAEDAKVPLTAAPRLGPGWWTSSSTAAEAGARYGFSLDGGPSRPDPRSGRQPLGVHGPSEVVDAGTFRWTDEGWSGRCVEGSVLYELHPGTFTDGGTLDAAIDRLDHLRDLGVDLVELMPVAAFDGQRGWGYDGVHLFAVHEPYGGPEALARFVDAAHARGLGVVLDVVYNHLGPSGNYTAEFGPYFTDQHTTPWGSGINLDGPESSEVRRWVIDNARRWLRDFHIDALRLDAVHALVDTSPRHLLAELSDEVAELSAELGRPLGLIAESDLNDPRTVIPTTAGGLGMTAQWADDVHHSVHALLTGERNGYYVDFGSLETLRTALTKAFVHAGGWSTFRGSPWGHPVPSDIDGHRFIVFSCDHDQVGNRALGDRPGRRPTTPGDPTRSEVDPADLDRLALAAALVLTSACTPMLFMGEEWGATTPWMFFTSFPDPQLGAAVTQGRTDEFAGHDWDAVYWPGVAVPDPQAQSTFDQSRLDWSEADGGGHSALLGWHRTLIGLRRTEPDIASGDRSQVAVSWSPDAADSAGQDGVLVVDRGKIRVITNLGQAPQTLLDVPFVGPAMARWGEAELDDADARVTLGGGAVVLLRLR